jgi:hypothetical protein
MGGESQTDLGNCPMLRRKILEATIEPFDSFWEAPDDIEKGYRSFGLFYRDNYLKLFPADKQANILCVSCQAVQLCGDGRGRCSRARVPRVLSALWQEEPSVQQEDRGHLCEAR